VLSSFALPLELVSALAAPSSDYATSGALLVQEAPKVARLVSSAEPTSSWTVNVSAVLAYATLHNRSFLSAAGPARSCAAS